MLEINRYIQSRTTYEEMVVIVPVEMKKMIIEELMERG